MKMCITIVYEDFLWNENEIKTRENYEIHFRICITIIIFLVEINIFIQKHEYIFLLIIINHNTIHKKSRVCFTKILSFHKNNHYPLLKGMKTILWKQLQLT